MDADVLKNHPHQRALGLPGRLLGDERLAREVSAGSERAFTVLFERYHQQLYRYCRSLTGSDHDAQDALQTTFTNALIALRDDRRSAPVRPWLYRIAHNESISIIRGRSITLEVPEELQSPQVVAESVEERERLATLMADLQELPERQRGALVMRELSGLSHEDIAAALQVSVGAAKQSILEARRSLLEFAEGRAMPCDEVQRIVSDDDRRSLRSRRVRAHLRTCPSCSAFAGAIPRRRADMLALYPALPAAGAAGLLTKITGGAGSGHGGGAGIAVGTAAKGVGATISAKVAVVAGTAVVATASVGAVAVLRHPAPSSSPPASGVLAAPSTVTRAAQKPSGRGHATASNLARAHGRGKAVSAGARRTVGEAHRATSGRSQAAGARGVSGAGHGRSGAHGSPSTHSHSATSIAGDAHGRAHTVPGKPATVGAGASNHNSGARGVAPARKTVKVHRKVKARPKKHVHPVAHRRHTTVSRAKASGTGPAVTASPTATSSPTTTVSSTSTTTSTDTTTSSAGGGGVGNGGTAPGQSGLPAGNKKSTTP